MASFTKESLPNHVLLTMKDQTFSLSKAKQEIFKSLAQIQWVLSIVNPFMSHLPVEILSTVEWLIRSYKLYDIIYIV